ncbi:MAG: hypothetical protein AB8C84_04165 [Oligoflexales bacterium]
MRKIFEITLLCFLWVGCGTDAADEDTSTATSYTFAADINPILTKSCGGSSCHAAGGSQTQYIDSLSNVLAASSTIKTRITTTTTSQIMPPDYSSLKSTFTSAEQQIIIDYLAQSTRN